MKRDRNRYSVFLRLTYNRGERTTAKVARKLELGEEVVPMRRMPLETASWLVTKGEGMGRRIYK